MSHTPGPWVFFVDDTDSPFYGEIRDCETLTLIAVMPPVDDRPDDFRLIAKAPELLERCEAQQVVIDALLAALENLLEGLDCLDTEWILKDLTDAAKKAIAKAKGNE